MTIWMLGLFMSGLFAGVLNLFGDFLKLLVLFVSAVRVFCVTFCVLELFVRLAWQRQAVVTATTVGSHCCCF